MNILPFTIITVQFRICADGSNVNIVCPWENQSLSSEKMSGSSTGGGNFHITHPHHGPNNSSWETWQGQIQKLLASCFLASKEDNNNKKTRHANGLILSRMEMLALNALELSSAAIAAPTTAQNSQDEKQSEELPNQNHIIPPGNFFFFFRFSTRNI